MKRFLFALVLVVSISGVAVAQDFPRVEIYGGYSAQRLDFKDEDFDLLESYYSNAFGDLGYSTSFSRSQFLKTGFTGSFAVNVNSVFGIAADVRYSYGDILDINVDDQDISIGMEYKDLAILAGPRFSFRSNRVTPFVHALVGLDYWKASSQAAVTESGSIPASEAEDKVLAMSFGGGFDVNLGDTVALRLVQFDYYMVRHEEITRNNLNFSAGIVFRLGSGY